MKKTELIFLFGAICMVSSCQTPYEKLTKNVSGRGFKNFAAPFTTSKEKRPLGKTITKNTKAEVDFGDIGFGAQYLDDPIGEGNVFSTNRSFPIILSENSISGKSDTSPGSYTVTPTSNVTVDFSKAFIRTAKKIYPTKIQTAGQFEVVSSVLNTGIHRFMNENGIAITFNKGGGDSGGGFTYQDDDYISNSAVASKYSMISIGEPQTSLLAKSEVIDVSTLGNNLTNAVLIFQKSNKPAPGNGNRGSVTLRIAFARTPEDLPDQKRIMPLLLVKSAPSEPHMVEGSVGWNGITPGNSYQFDLSRESGKEVAVLPIQGPKGSFITVNFDGFVSGTRIVNGKETTDERGKFLIQYSSVK